MSYGKKKGSEDKLERYYIRQDERPGQVGAAYGPTDPRSSKPVGGARLGTDFPFMDGASIPRLEKDRIIEACKAIVGAQKSYKGLLYLSRCKVEDTETIFRAAESSDVRQRWERLWVLSPYLSRVTRHPDGRDTLVRLMKDDLSAVHLLSKFIQHKNEAVKGMFKRLRDPLLAVLLKNLNEQRNDYKRVTLLTEIIEVIETDREALAQALHMVPGVKNVEELLSMLIVRRSKRLSPSSLGKKLQELGND